MKYVVTKDDREWEVEINDNEDGTFHVLVDGRPVRADFIRGADRALCSLILGQHSYEVLVTDENGGVAVLAHGLGVELEVESERERNARLLLGEGDSAGEGRIAAVMPGIVVAVPVAAGDPVAKGQAVVVLEAMKMENEIRSPVDGVVTAVHVTAGQTVNGGDLLVEIGDAEVAGEG